MKFISTDRGVIMDWNSRPLQKLLRATAPVLMTAAITLVAVWSFEYLLPFVLALLVAAMVWPLVDWLEKFKVNRVLSSVICLSAFFLSSGTLITLLIIQTSQDLLGLASEIPSILREANTVFSGLISQLEQAYHFIPPNLSPYVDQAITQLASKGMTFAQDAAAWLLSGISKMPGFLLVLIFAILASYIITLDLSNITTHLSSRMDHTTRQRIRTILEEMASALGKYLKALIILVGITFAVTLTGMTLIGVDYALVGSFIIAIADLLPVLGPGAVFVPWILWLLVMGETSKSLMMLGLYGFIFVFRQALQPKVLADTMELPALPLLIAIWIGLTQFGIGGLLLAPFILVLHQAIDNALKTSLKMSDTSAQDSESLL